jgi:serine/threonine protein kinase
VRIFGQVADALAYAHQQGVVHRDLKPNNILLDRNDNAYLTDFGIAKMVESKTNLTQAGMVMGTPAYMAPELWRAEPIDLRIDIYALGIMLYEMLTGQHPFKADTPYSLMYKHMDTPMPSPSLVRFDVPPGIAAAIRKATAKQRSDRYASAGLFARDVNAALTGTSGTGVSAQEPMRTLVETGVPASEGSTAFAPGSESTPADARTFLEQPEADSYLQTPGPTRPSSPTQEKPKRMPARSPLPLVVGGAALVVVLLAGMAILLRGSPVPVAIVSTPTYTNVPTVAPTTVPTTVPITAPTTAPASGPTALPAATGITPTVPTALPTQTNPPPTATVPSARLIVFRDQDTLFLYLPDTPQVALDSLALEAQTAQGVHLSKMLKDYPSFLGLPFDKMHGPICFRLTTRNSNSAVPLECRSLPAGQMLTERLTPADLIWYDTAANEQRRVVFTISAHEVGQCPATQNRCEISVPYDQSFQQ